MLRSEVKILVDELHVACIALSVLADTADQPQPEPQPEPRPQRLPDPRRAPGHGKRPDGAEEAAAVTRTTFITALLVGFTIGYAAASLLIIA